MKNILAFILLSCLGAVALAEAPIVLDCVPLLNGAHGAYSHIQLWKYTDTWKGKTIAHYDVRATAFGQQKFFLLNPSKYFDEDYDQYTVIYNGIPVPAFAVLAHKQLDYAVLINDSETKTHECRVQ